MERKSTAAKYFFSNPSFLICKVSDNVFESQDLFKYMYSIKLRSRAHKLVIEIYS